MNGPDRRRLSQLLRKHIPVAFTPKQIYREGLDKLEIPEDPQLFYESFGLLTHPDPKRKGQLVKRLARYQLEPWENWKRYPYELVIKAKKIGFSTSTLLRDLQHAMKHYRGKEILIIAQSQQHANEHIRSIKYMMLNSERYRRFLIRSSEEMPFKEEKTKVGMAYIYNPDNPYLPTRIIGLGSNEASVWSWKNVAHIHMSDIAAAKIKDDSGLFAVAFSRLANTNGTMIIESTPRGQRGMIYKIWKASQDRQADVPEGSFKVYTIPYREAIEAGVMSEEFIAGEREHLGAMFPMYYECEFLAEGTAWYPPDMLRTGREGAEW